MKHNFDLIEWNDLNKNSSGGSEMMLRRIYDGTVPRELLEKVQIVPSRLRELDKTKHRIVLFNDLPLDPESQFLKNGGWNDFHKLVFVSHWQRDQYINVFGIPYSKCAVMHNAIDTKPFRGQRMYPSGPIKFVYTSTPHRGLDILVHTFDQLCKLHEDIELHVYSSFGIYGWESRDEEPGIKNILEACKEHEKIVYHGWQKNDVVLAALKDMDVFAYPSVWPETYCLSLVEAMAAGLICVHPNFAALPEVAAGWNMSYDMHEEKGQHAAVFLSMLESAYQAAKQARKHQVTIVSRLDDMQAYVRRFHDWQARAPQWTALLKSVLAMPLIEEEFFQYTS